MSCIFSFCTFVAINDLQVGSMRSSPTMLCLTLCLSFQLNGCTQQKAGDEEQVKAALGMESPNQSAQQPKKSVSGQTSKEPQLRKSAIGGFLRFDYVPAGRYGDTAVRPLVVFDDGSGERTVSSEELLRHTPPGPDGRRVRTTGVLRVAVYMFDGQDTLATASAELSLHPDHIWTIMIAPGYAPSGALPRERLDPRVYKAVPLRRNGEPATADSLYLIWLSWRRSDASTT